MGRNETIQALTGAILRVDRDHPTRVAIDGVDAAGKTTLAAELSRSVEASGRTVVRASIDGFHRPREERYRQGLDSPVGYFEDSFDHAAVVSHLLVPLGPGGSLEFCGRVFDYRTDLKMTEIWERTSWDAVLLFDGVFLLRPELREHWDFTIYVHAEFGITVERAARRDASAFGSERAARERYMNRYVPGQRLYLERCRPLAAADVAVDNNDFWGLRILEPPGPET